MARRMFPDDQFTYVLAGNPTGDPSVPGIVGVPIGSTVHVYTDQLATTPADVRHSDGSPVTFGNPIQVDAYSQVSLFQGPDDGTDTLWVVITSGPPKAMYARVDDRIDELAAQISGLDFVETSTVAAGTTTPVVAAQLSGDLVPRVELRADGTISMADAPVSISNVTGTSTVTVTTASNHGYGTNDVVLISGVQGFTGANGTFTITQTTATAFTLNGATGSGSYTGGGAVQRRLGDTGSANEGVWNLLIPDTTRPGQVIRGHEGNSHPLAQWNDYRNAPVFIWGAVGGGGLTSATASDILFATNNIFNRAFAANPTGGVRLTFGDPAGSTDTLSIGNALTPPTGNPDGTHLGEGSFTTTEGVVLWSRGGRLRLRTSAGHEDEVIAPVHRVVRSIAAPGGSATLDTGGTVAPTVATTNITASADDQAAGPLAKYLTTAAASVDAGVITAFGPVQARWAPLFYARIQTDASAITSTRLAVGLVSADVASNAGPASTGAYTTAQVAMFRFDTGVDGTNFWRTVTGNATTATVTTTTAAIAADTSYELVIEVNSAGTSIRFWVGTTLVATHTTNLPSTSAALGVTARLRTLTTSARALRLGRLSWSQK